MVLAGHSVALVHWKGNTFGRQETLSHSVNKILSIAAPPTMVARVDGWIMLLITSGIIMA